MTAGGRSGIADSDSYQGEQGGVRRVEGGRPLVCG